MEEEADAMEEDLVKTERPQVRVGKKKLVEELTSPIREQKLTEEKPVEQEEPGRVSSAAVIIGAEGRDIGGAGKRQRAQKIDEGSLIQ